jgi:hypothetical protein
MCPNRLETIMLGFMKRGFTAVVLALFLVQATGCAFTRRDAQLMDAIRKQEPIVGVTTKAGRPIPFDGPGWIAGDTVYGPVKTKPWLEQPDTAYSIPVEEIEHAWVRRTGVPTGVLVGVGVVSAAILFLTAIELRDAGIPLRW